MTAVFLREFDDDRATMRALVLGVGRFPFVDAGLDAARKACPDSARAMIDFLIQHQDRFDAPLGSIECLISDPRNARGSDRVPMTGPNDPRRGDEMVDAGSIDHVRKACEDWLKKGKPGDVYFFYGCSHGVAGRDENGLFVCEDWKKFRNDAEGLLDVRSIADDLPRGVDASASWVFLDACQEVLPELATMRGGVRAYQPVSASYQSSNKVRSVSLAAAVHGGVTFAPDEGQAYFTEVLIKGLTECLVEPNRNRWEVTGHAIARLDRLYPALKGRDIETAPLGISGFRYRLMVIDDPRVAVAVETVPQTLISTAEKVEVFVDRPNVDRRNAKAIVKRNNTEPVWRFSLPLEERRFFVRMEHQQSAERYQDFHLDPPATLVSIPQ